MKDLWATHCAVNSFREFGMESIFFAWNYRNSPKPALSTTIKVLRHRIVTPLWFLERIFYFHFASMERLRRPRTSDNYDDDDDDDDNDFKLYQ